ncbi:extracellular solute-binding protein [Patescibacteria group bacterium]|nr:extracellular solute-binding protein [Patescibacteria group bacterium]MBU1672937.1 extracellular solute-binding protein [Patescibacteria group bacterium]MBU1963579.1 extracellular solute-binding protein [Patescibacteria group bacterium]MBU1963588.1 extracellular solute-binding protein [Patescibacteria group bacterium]
MKLKKYAIFSGLLGILAVLVFTGQLCSQSEPIPKAFTLEFWGVFDEEDYFQAQIAAFKANYPYVTIEYKKFRQEEYEQALFDAWAKGEGPDIFAVPNSYMGKYKEFIEPMPQAMNVVTVTTESTLGKEETVAQAQAIKSWTPSQLRALYPDVVYMDTVYLHKTEDEKTATEKVFGLPLSIDTLALYYNKDILNQSQIALPPLTWTEFLEDVKKVTLIDKQGNIVRSGASMGTSNNIPRFFDIVSILMMQNGSAMVEDTNVVFTQPSTTQEGYYPGVSAVDFYTSFASPDREAYSWNEDLPEAMTYFAEGNVAFFLGYHYMLEEIQSESPNLNFDIASLPQVDPNVKVNYANYWNYSVAVNSEQSDMAWYFVQFLCSEENAAIYLEETGRPAALKNLIATQEDIYELTPFLDQLLTAASWYRGREPEAAENIFAEMIDGINDGVLTLDEAVKSTADKIELTYYE